MASRAEGRGERKREGNDSTMEGSDTLLARRGLSPPMSRPSSSRDRGELVVGKKFKNIRSTLLLEAATAGDDVACSNLIDAGIPLECKDVRAPRPHAYNI